MLDLLDSTSDFRTIEGKYRSISQTWLTEKGCINKYVKS